MARLPRRPPVSSPATLRPETNASSPLDRDGVSAPESLGRDPRLNSARTLDERHGRHLPPQSQSFEDGVELEAAIDSMLAAGGVDPITRVRLNEARRAIADSARGEDPDGFEGVSLSRSLFRFVMPRLHHPEVLRAERHRALLEGLADGLAQTDDDGIVREGALVIHRELRRLALLRAGRNALVEG